jgi:putative transposase
MSPFIPQGGIKQQVSIYTFDLIEYAQSLATQWMWVYNNERLHCSIDDFPPRKLLEAI